MSVQPALPTRQVTLVLCDRAGAVVGRLPPFEVALPWWQEVADVVAGARAHSGVEVTVLRLLAASSSSPAEGGAVSYLAEVSGPVPAATPGTGADAAVDDDPLRQTYARPGGPAADLAWADGHLSRLGMPRAASAQQVRTWNLSSLWRLPTASGAAWLKVVPPFFAHEGEMLSRLGRDHPGLVPRLLAADGPRVLMAEVPGGDHYDADLPVLLALVRSLVGLQAEWASRVSELTGLGVPDWRGDSFVAMAEDVLARTADQLDREVVDRLEGLVAGLDGRFRGLADCGVPDSLVHGDFHPGNACGDPDRPVLLDWGDSGVGHPMLDQAAFTARLQGSGRAEVLRLWSQLWRRAVPGAEPDRAAGLLGPVTALRQAVVYRSFLDGIEESERVYHARDPATWLRRAARLG